MPKSSFTIRCRPVVQGWPEKDNGPGAFRAIPSIHLPGLVTNALIYGPNTELFSILNTNEFYEVTLARYKRTFKDPLDKKGGYSVKGLKIIKVEHEDLEIYKDFKDVTEE